MHLLWLVSNGDDMYDTQDAKSAADSLIQWSSNILSKPYDFLCETVHACGLFCVGFDEKFRDDPS